MTRPTHLFLADDGALHDTRDAQWARKPLRADYARAFTRITNTAQLRATLRHGPYTWPGGYPLYFITDDGAALSFEGVRQNLRAILDSIATKAHDGWRVVACEVNWENLDITCEHTGKPIEATYGEPDECATCAASTETRAAPCDECGHLDSDEGEASQ